MMHPDHVHDIGNKNDEMKDQSSPSRRYHHHQSKDAIETTSQMHSLDYNRNDLQDEYYNISVVHKEQNHQSVSTDKTNQSQGIVRPQENESSVNSTDNNSSSNSSHRSGWFSLPWYNYSKTTGGTNHQTQRMTSINEETSLHDPMNTTANNNHNTTNQYDDIIPSSPKRRGRKNFNLLQSTTMTTPTSSLYQQVKTIGPIESNHDMNDHDTTTTPTDMEYSSLHDPEQQQQQPTTSNSNASTDIHKDYSFFFRSEELDSSNRRNRTNSQKSIQYPEWKTIRKDHYKRHNSGGLSIMYEYSDAVAVTPMPILQQYRTKFAQLNSELITERGSRHQRELQYYLDQHQQQQSYPYKYFNYDKDHLHVVLEQQRDPFDDWHMQQSSLQLQEYDTTDVATNTSGHNEFIPESLPYYNANGGIPRTCGKRSSTLRQSDSSYNHGIVRSDTARQSSLFFMAHGRILMRLPRDRVRLLVDPDLEVGVLSVEQWRMATTVTTNDSTYTTDYGIQNDTTNSIANTDPESPTPLPELRYVLTVSDDLYRKIVEEMSPTSIKYFCCTRACCNDEEKVDIRIAFVLLGSTLLILFINMVAFRET